MSPGAKLRDTGNDLLDQLPAAEFELLEPILKRVSVNLKQVVSQHEAKVTHVHFPTTALISLPTVLEDGDPVEVATRVSSAGRQRWASRRALTE